MDVVVLLKVESELEIEDISATLGRESSVSFRKGQTLSVNTKAFARAFHLIGESLLKQEEVSLAQEDLFDKFHYFENSDLSALFDIKEDSQETIVTRNLWIIREKYKDQEDITFALKSFLNNNEKTLQRARADRRLSLALKVFIVTKWAQMAFTLEEDLQTELEKWHIPIAFDILSWALVIDEVDEMTG